MKWGIIAALAISILLGAGVLYSRGDDVGYFLKKASFLGSLSFLEQDASYGVLALFGLLTSLHCVAMCGGLILTQTLSGAGKGENRRDGSSDKTPLFYAGLYNAGRVISYTLAGALAGGLGRVLTFSGRFTGVIPILGGAFMVLLGVNSAGIFPFLRKLSFPLPKGFAKFLYKGVLKGKSPLLVGLLTVLMPCGPLQIAQIYAISTKSVLIGALSMFAFALGTVPALFLFGVFSETFGKKFSHIVTKVGAVVVCLMGLTMIGRGLALSGIPLPTATLTRDSDDFAASVVVGDFQRLTTEFGAYRYTPIQLKAGVPVVWTILVREENYNSCNNAIELPAFGLKAKLNAGETIVKFTPDREGDFVYTCWMGMIKSTIRVVN
ncbi:MAG: sulfite exporter TauE/SafE family protein [Synergistaceae bacterium]|jgi:sulfite exporter TauE/SafE|nr:sulfite exporter TauE/SafE family protein [Synergistaceae bacterium]